MEQGQSGGRANQRARTRSALLESAVTLIRKGERPTVEEAATAVGISKRTAYRYFASQDHLLADAALESLRGEMDTILTSASPSGDVHARVRALAVAMCRLAETHEAELRVMIRSSLDQHARRTEDAQNAPVRARGSRRLDWIDTALAPVRERLPPDRYSRLRYSLAVCLGIDALIVLRDVCSLNGSAAEDVMAWSAIAILDRALSEAAYPSVGVEVF